MAELDPTILSFYRDRYDEDQRLVRSRHGRLEFRRTKQLLRRYLPAPPATVLDVGGGTGIHARWLAEDGYDVHLIDPVANHIAQASTHLDFTAGIGDARSVSVADQSFDVVLASVHERSRRRRRRRRRRRPVLLHQNDQQHPLPGFQPGGYFPPHDLTPPTKE